MLNPKNLGYAAGILWSICMFFMTIIAMYTGYGVAFLELMMSIYPGYAITWPGSFFGLIYGFIDGFVGLYLFGWLYNKLNG